MSQETIFALYVVIIAVSGSAVFCVCALLGGFLSRVDKDIRKMMRRELIRRKKYNVLLKHSK